MTYSVTNPELFAQVANVDVQKNGRTTNVQINLNNGDWIESDGEHGPDDFKEYGIRLS